MPKAIPIPQEPKEPWTNPWRGQIPTKPPTKAEKDLRAILKTDAKTHLARMFAPVR